MTRPVLSFVFLFFLGVYFEAILLRGGGLLPRGFFGRVLGAWMSRCLQSSWRSSRSRSSRRAASPLSRSTYTSCCPRSTSATTRSVRQLRHHFWTISRALLSSTHPHTHRVICSTSCPYCLGADWCLESDVVTNLGLQARCAGSPQHASTGCKPTRTGRASRSQSSLARIR